MPTTATESEVLEDGHDACLPGTAMVTAAMGPEALEEDSRDACPAGTVMEDAEDL